MLKVRLALTVVATFTVWSACNKPPQRYAVSFGTSDGAVATNNPDPYDNTRASANSTGVDGSSTSSSNGSSSSSSTADGATQTSTMGSPTTNGMTTSTSTMTTNGNTTSSTGTNSGMGTNTGTGTGTTGTTSNPPMKVPASQAVFYKPLGLTSGGYQKIRTAKFPDVCEKGDVQPTTGALFPFNEAQTLVLRGPMYLSDIAVYQKNGSTWNRVADASSLEWQEDNYGTYQKVSGIPSPSKLLENGREIFATLPGSGEKMVFVNVKMPYPTSAPATGDQDNVPAVWMLNSHIFEAPSGQYFCNCRGLGNPGGCGELDIAEIIPGKPDQVTTTIYSYEGAVGGFLASARPTKNFQIYGAILHADGSAGEVAVLEAASFDFTIKEIPDSFVAKEWLPSARRLNAGGEALNPPPK